MTTKPKTTKTQPKTLYVVPTDASEVFVLEGFYFKGDYFEGSIAYYTPECGSEVYALFMSANPNYPSYFLTEVEANKYRVTRRKQILRSEIRSLEKKLASFQAEYKDLG